ncbi:MAG: YggS family pyridoxal phosphate-dependent enzyme [Eubacteriales bacterium]|nr:YggS family pyridoxal phosphate-dependent enzyme [Eubacteriales bacterium]
MIEDSGKIIENLDMVKEKVRRAAVRAGRNPDDITIVAVTKNATPEMAKVAIETGITDLGENRVQELQNKYSRLGEICNWHLIGHLQRNKVKYIVDKVKLIHSVESMELVNELQLRAADINRVMDILVQINVSGEESKTGLRPEDTLSFLKEISGCANIKVRGLMTMAPYAENPESVRWVFKGLKQLALDITAKKIHNINMDFLSMGMSNDFEKAIEEGSNIVRIGSSIFGKPTY